MRRRPAAHRRRRRLRPGRPGPPAEAGPDRAALPCARRLAVRADQRGAARPRRRLPRGVALGGEPRRARTAAAGRGGGGHHGGHHQPPAVHRRAHRRPRAGLGRPRDDVQTGGDGLQDQPARGGRLPLRLRGAAHVRHLQPRPAAHPRGAGERPPGLGRVLEVAPSAHRAGPAASGACDRKAEGRPRSGPTRTTPTTQRACVPDAAGQAGLPKHGLGPARPAPRPAPLLGARPGPHQTGTRSFLCASVRSREEMDAMSLKLPASAYEAPR
ncbi:exported hypothetical protein [Actinacidiphila bryophytorum]|uniref:Uncharacterized protein n=1 Tax=Actinacidiphila bryophytorum TaxID=1436133 RepID=A0A9W4ECC9_9ACTN|nr:exported hypothetical protein [Actinacidiphila bryophytorum]